MSVPRIVLITGATGNLGEAVAKAFLDAGDIVVLSGRNRARLNELQSVLTPFERVEINVSDPGHPGGAQALVDDVVSRRGRIDCLIHLIGVFSMANVTDADDALWSDVIAANALTAAYLLKRVLPGMTERGWGKAVFMSSIAVHNPGAGLGPYAGAKMALEAIAKSAAEEVKDSGVNVNVVAITTLDTPDARKSMPKTDPSHFIAPVDVAETILYLCSDKARAINGAVVSLMGRGSMTIKL